MGGFRLPPSADAILSVVTSVDPLPLHRLEHHVCQNPPPADLPSLLAGLSHVTSRLHAKSVAGDGIRRLVDAALRQNVVAVCAMSSEAADAYAAFAKNLLSVDAAYVEVLLQRVVPRIFLAPVEADGHDAAVDLALSLISAAVRTHHRRAVPLLIDAFRAKYPHPVRPAAEHISYARALLRVARASDTPRSMLRALVAAVFERLSAIEALADMDKTHCVLLEFCQHIQTAHTQSSPDSFIAVHVDAIFAAYESLVVPVSSARQTQYTLLYALALAGQNVTISLAEQLRKMFNDPNVADRLRTKYLEHSAAIVVRARTVSGRDALRWVVRVAAWLNTYVDAVEHHLYRDQQLTQPDHSQHQMLDDDPHSPLAVDVELHHIFYTACAILMDTIARRKDILSGRSAPEIIARLRLRRILECALTPLRVIPQAVVNQFNAVVSERAGLNVEQIISEGHFCPVPTRTRSGARNIFEYSFGCPDLEFDRVLEIITDHMRWDRPREKDVENGSKDVEMVNKTPEITPLKRVRFVDNVSVRPSPNRLMSSMSAV